MNLVVRCLFLTGYVLSLYDEGVAHRVGGYLSGNRTWQLLLSDLSFHWMGVRQETHFGGIRMMSRRCMLSLAAASTTRGCFKRLFRLLPQRLTRGSKLEDEASDIFLDWLRKRRRFLLLNIRETYNCSSCCRLKEYDRQMGPAPHYISSSRKWHNIAQRIFGAEALSLIYTHHSFFLLLQFHSLAIPFMTSLSSFKPSSAKATMFASLSPPNPVSTSLVTVP